MQTQVEAGVAYQTTPTVKWEYKIVSASNEEKKLNAMGADGWELVWVQKSVADFHDLYLKRKVQ